MLARASSCSITFFGGKQLSQVTQILLLIKPPQIIDRLYCHNVNDNTHGSSSVEGSLHISNPGQDSELYFNISISHVKITLFWYFTWLTSLLQLKLFMSFSLKNHYHAPASIHYKHPPSSFMESIHHILQFISL